LAGDVLITHHRDQPGVIGQMGTILGRHGVNIAGMQVGRHERGGEALMVTNVDDAIPEDALAEAGPALFDAWRAQRGARELAEAARRVVAALAGGDAPSVAPDERILRAVAYVHAHLDAPLTLDAVAAEACLSPSRFRHLFVEQTGMALRPYILWRRMLRVWELTAAGGSLSSAAHEAGFADAAHLSRTSRRMFGFPPSSIRFTEPPPETSAPPFKPAPPRRS